MKRPKIRTPTAGILAPNPRWRQRCARTTSASLGSTHGRRSLQASSGCVCHAQRRRGKQRVGLLRLPFVTSVSAGVARSRTKQRMMTQVRDEGGSGRHIASIGTETPAATTSAATRSTSTRRLVEFGSLRQTELAAYTALTKQPDMAWAKLRAFFEQTTVNAVFEKRSTVVGRKRVFTIDKAIVEVIMNDRSPGLRPDGYFRAAA